jgi:hypothetical protein
MATRGIGRANYSHPFTGCVVLLLWSITASAQEAPVAETTKPAAAAPRPAKTQAELEEALSKMLTGATLEGSFTSTGRERNVSELRRDRYTLGEVKKLEGKTWMIQARIQYRDSDAVMVPLPLPIEWAGDTPVITVDNFTIPGMGTFSARVMFFDDHYAGYWKHGDRGGNMFGVVRRADAPKAAPQPTRQRSN